eukprot:s632_g1.t2
MFFRAAVLVGLCACLLGLLDYVVTPSYPVPESGGAVLITGASTGIGLHAAGVLAENGFRVYAGVRSEKAKEEVKKMLPGGAVVPVILDVTLEDTVAAAARFIQEQQQPLVGLVNCAGLSRRLPLELESLEAVKELYEVNVFGVTRVAALLPHRGSSSYSGSKAALEMMTDALRLELAPWKISVSIVEPGYVKTPLAAKQTGENAPMYQDWIDSSDLSRQQSQDMAPGPEVTSQAILDALRNPKPKTRYVVANVKHFPAWTLTFLAWLLPDRIKDLIVKKQEDLEKSAINQAPVVERTAQHGARRWWHLNLTKSLGLLQTSGTVTRNTVLDPAILVIGLVSMVIALSAFMAFCTSSSSGKRKVTRYPAPAGKVPDFLPAEEMAQKGRCLSTALRARGKGESMRPSEVNNPPSSVSVPAASDTSLPPPQEPKHIGGEEGGMFNWSPRSAEDIETLCPCLVVPDGMEFVFAVREVLTVVRQESGMPRA